MPEERDLTPEEWREGLRIWAEQICEIPEGEKRGRWTRADRVAVITFVLTHFARKAGAPV